jgi:hypothetical protein
MAVPAAVPLIGTTLADALTTVLAVTVLIYSQRPAFVVLTPVYALDPVKLVSLAGLNVIVTVPAKLAIQEAS